MKSEEKYINLQMFDTIAYSIDKHIRNSKNIL